MATVCKTWFVPENRFRGLCSQSYYPKTGTDECPICVQPAPTPAFKPGTCGCPPPSGEAARTWTVIVGEGSEPNLLSSCEQNFIGTYVMSNRDKDYPDPFFPDMSPFSCAFSSNELAYTGYHPSPPNVPCYIPVPIPPPQPGQVCSGRASRVTITPGNPRRSGSVPDPPVYIDGNKKYRAGMMVALWFAPPVDCIEGKFYYGLQQPIFSVWYADKALPACDYYEPFDVALKPVVTPTDELLGYTEEYWYKRINVRLKGS